MRKTAVIAAVLSLLAVSCTSKRQAVVDAEGYSATVQTPEKGKKAKDGRTGSKAADRTSAAVINEARRWLGTRYRYGGSDRSGTDCSGMVMAVYRDAAGIKLPRDSRSQQSFCKPVKTSQLREGDLVFFASKSGGSRVGHVGIYIGDGDFIHASTSKGVMVSNLKQDYYARHFHSAGRVPQLDGILPDEILDFVPGHKEAAADTVEVPATTKDSIRAEVLRAMFL